MSITPTLDDVIEEAISRFVTDLHTAIPAKILDYDATTQTCTAQPLIKRASVGEDGERVVELLPPVNHAPVLCIGGNGFAMTFPLTAGDTVLLICSMLSIAKWMSVGQSDPVDPDDDEQFDLTDAIVIPGVRNIANALSTSPTDGMTIGRDGGTANIKITATEIQAGGTDELAKKSDNARIIYAITNAAVGGADGGATYKTNMIALLAGYPVGTSTLKGG